MFNLTVSQSRPSFSSSHKSTSTKSSILHGLRRSFDSDMKSHNSDSYSDKLSSSSASYAEDMDDDNIAWGPVSHKKRAS